MPADANNPFSKPNHESLHLPLPGWWFLKRRQLDTAWAKIAASCLTCLHDDNRPQLRQQAMGATIMPPAAEDLPQVPLERPGLEAAEHREARGAIVQGAAPDPVVRVRARSVPGFAVEGPIIFMPRPVSLRVPHPRLLPEGRAQGDRRGRGVRASRRGSRSRRAVRIPQARVAAAPPPWQDPGSWNGCARPP